MLVMLVLEELPSQNCFQKRCRGGVLKVVSKVFWKDFERFFGGALQGLLKDISKVFFEKCSERCWRCFEKAFPSTLWP